MASEKKYKVIGYYIWDNGLASYARWAEIFYSEYDYASINEVLKDPITKANLRIELRKIYPDIEPDFNKILSSKKETEELIKTIKQHKLQNILERKYPDSAQSWDDVEMDIKLEKSAGNSEAIKRSVIDQIKAKPGQLPQEIQITDKSFISDGVIFTGEGTVEIGDYSTIDAAPNENISTFIDGRLYVGEFCHIRHGAEVGSHTHISNYSIVGRICRMGDYVTIRKTVLCGGNNIGRESLLENKILPEYCDIPPFYNEHNGRVLDIRGHTTEKSEPLKSNVPAFIRDIGMNFNFSDAKTMEFYEFAHKEKRK